MCQISSLMAATEGPEAQFSSFANFEKRKRKTNLLMSFPKIVHQKDSFGQIRTNPLLRFCRPILNIFGLTLLRRDSSKDAFNVLGWTKLETKQKRHKCVLVYKCLNNLVPQYLSDYFTRNYNLHSYNTHRKTDLHLPKVKLSLAKRTFRYSGSALFNLLPRSMQKAESLSSFKILINTHNV